MCYVHCGGLHPICSNLVCKTIDSGVQEAAVIIENVDQNTSSLTCSEVDWGARGFH